MTIALNQVTKKYGKKNALHDVSLEFEKGKIYGLLGPNGSGKSTTLKLIAGLVYPNSGQVEVLGEKVTRKISKHVAYLTELDMFYEPFTVKKMIDYYATQFADFNMEKAYALMQDMKLEGEQKIKQLSKGNRGRLKLVLALSRETPVLLLDEPFSGLDPLVRESIVKSLLSYLDFEEQTVIIATHEIDEIESLLDKVLVINNGHIIGQEEVEDIREFKGQSVQEWLKALIKE